MRTVTHPHGEQLSAYIDGMLDVSRMRGIGEHLQVCASCHAASENLRDTKFLLRGMSEPPVPDAEFWTNTYRRLRVDDQTRTVVRRPFWEMWLLRPEHTSQRRWAAGLAAAALTAALFAGPLTPAPGPLPVSVPTVAAPDISPDVTSLVESHTDSVSRLPLADPDRQKMLAADVQQSSDVQQSGPNAPEAADYADGTF